MLTHKQLNDAIALDLVERGDLEPRVVRGLLRYFAPENPGYIARVGEWQEFLAAGNGQLSHPELFRQAGAIQPWGSGYILDDAYAIRGVHQIAMLYWKEEVPVPPDWDSFSDVISSSGRYDCPVDIERKLRARLASWLGKPPQWQDLSPVMGTGVTADRCDAEERWFIPSRPLDIPDDFYRYNARDPRRFTPAIPISRAAAVPKNRKSCRYVASEPVGALCGQLALKRFIDKRCEHLFRTRAPLGNADKHIAFMLSDQDNVTLDLSSASDLLSVEAMYRLLPCDWFSIFMECRSQGVQLPNGNVIPCAAFATMGNGFCFRALTLVTAAVCSILKCKFSVYGDDLVVHRSVAYSVMYILESIGLKVNAQKCCMNRYRETCGAEVLGSFRIDPFKPKSILHHRGEPADVVQSLRALELQLPTTSQLLRSGLGECPTRYNSYLQYLERRVPARVIADAEEVQVDDWPGISRWAFLNAHLDAPSPFYDEEVRKYARTRVSYTWIRDNEDLTVLAAQLPPKGATART